MPVLNDEYITRMEDVLRLYEAPYNPSEPVVCLDERPVQLLDDVRESHRVSDGSLRRVYEYRRCGTANIFCGVEPLGGRHFTKVTPTRDRFEFAEMLREIAAAYPNAKRIHLVMDNLSTHGKSSLLAAFDEVTANKLWKRFRPHYTPKHGSWLNQAEIEISLVSRECLGKTPSKLNPGATRTTSRLEQRREPKKAHDRVAIHAPQGADAVRLLDHGHAGGGLVRDVGSRRSRSQRQRVSKATARQAGRAPSRTCSGLPRSRAL